MCGGALLGVAAPNFAFVQTAQIFSSLYYAKVLKRFSPERSLTL
jgi:hypothetical protein